MDQYQLRNEQGQYLCYNEGFYYEWVDAHLVELGQHVGPAPHVGRDYAELKIREASSPKWQRNMVRPDYPDMTGARAEYAGQLDW